MPDGNTFRNEAPGTCSPAGEAGGAVSPANLDPGTAPTVSGNSVERTLTLPTFVDPEAPIHRGATLPEGSRPATRNHVALPVGYELHEYTIEALLGTGSFGLTYLARDNNLQCQVAIKEYLPNDLAVRTAGQTVCAKTESDTHGYRIGLNGFLAESRVLASFRHPNIVRVTRFFEANKTAYMVMDYERGEPLRDWVKLNGPVDEAQLLKMFIPLLEGLDVVHRARVLHRDIKPANIYVREEDGSLVLLDFGAARYARSDDSRSLTSIVTPGFAPLEQYHTHGAQGPWSDLYAFGGVLYWVVTGEKPLEAPSRVKNDAMPTALSLARGRYSERLLRAIDWALTPDETDRPKSVSQLRAVLTGEVAAPPPPIPKAASVPMPVAAVPSKVKRPLLLGAASMAVMVAASFAFYPKAEPPAQMAVEQAPAAAPAKTEVGEAPKTATPKPVAPVAKKPAKESVAARSAVDSPQAADKTKAQDAAAAATATVILDVTPQGEIVLDGKKAGVAPPLNRLVVSADTQHKIEIHGSGPSHYWTVDLKPGEKREIRANFLSSY